MPTQPELEKKNRQEVEKLDANSRGGEMKSMLDAISRRKFVGGTAALGLAGVTTPVQAQGDDSVDTPEEAEIRSMSIHPRWYWGDSSVEESRAAMQDFLDMTAEAGINLLFAWIESPGVAALFGEPGYVDRYAFWDPGRWGAMGELIDEAAQREIEVHLWYSFTRYKTRSNRPREWVPEYDDDLQVLPPGNPDWASVRKSEYEEGHTDPTDPGVSGHSLCANEFDAHKWTLEVVDRLLDRYPGLAGFHVEEPGYLAFDRCVCYRCQNIYRELYDEPGENLLDHTYDNFNPYTNDDKAIPVKVYGTNAFVEDLDRLINNTYPDRIVSFNGSWSAEQDRARARNWAEWTEQGMVPYYSPQSYAFQTDTVRDQVQTTMEAISGDNRGIFPSIGLGWSWGENDPETVVNQIQAVRDLDGYADTPIAGVNLFSGMALDDEVVQALRDGPFASSAPLPWETETPTEDEDEAEEETPSSQEPSRLDESELEQRNPLSRERQSAEDLPGGGRRDPNAGERSREPEPANVSEHRRESTGLDASERRSEIRKARNRLR